MIVALITYCCCLTSGLLEKTVGLHLEVVLDLSPNCRTALLEYREYILRYLFGDNSLGISPFFPVRVRDLARLVKDRVGHTDLGASPTLWLVTMGN